MPKRRRPKSAFQKPKRKSVGAATEISPELKVEVTDFKIINPRLRRKSRFLYLVGDSHFVGAMRWMLRGCLACGTFVSVLFIFPNLGVFIENTTLQILSYLPEKFAPPDIYLPAVLVSPFMLLLIAGFTAFGYWKGSTPPEIETEADERTPKDKFFEFIFFLVICVWLILYRLRGDHPKFGLAEIILHPVFIILAVVITLVVLYYVYSPRQSIPLLIFVLNSVIAVAFSLFLFGLTAYTLFKSFAHALSQ